MSKKVRLDASEIEALAKEFAESLTKSKGVDGKITFSKTLESTERKADLYFDEMAWLKMSSLVQSYDKEVAWHGVCERGADPGVYIVTDVLVYPQVVTGSTVEMDETEYAKWLVENGEDERFYNIHMQGHSHVNMATNPSGTDLAHQSEIVSQLGDEDFYIFVIWNKKGDRNIKIYDLEENVLYENGDVSVHVLDGEYNLQAFIEDAKDLVEIYESPKPAVQAPQPKKEFESCKGSGKKHKPQWGDYYGGYGWY